MKFKKGDKIRYVGPDINSYCGKTKHGTTGVISEVYARGVNIITSDCDHLGFNHIHAEWNMKYIVKQYQWRKL